MEHNIMPMDIEAPRPARKAWVKLFRFPARWAVEKPAVESLFARGIWLLVPVQYYVVTHIAHGLSSDDLIPAVILSLVSLAAIFLVSCASAWSYALLDGLDPAGGDTLSGRVRMWVVALMICLVGAYALLAVSFGIRQFALSHDVAIYGDLIAEAIRALLPYLGLAATSLDQPVRLLGAWAPIALSPLQILANLGYGFAAVFLMTALLRLLRRGAPSSMAAQEPDAVMVGLIVGALVTFANAVATAD